MRACIENYIQGRPMAAKKGAKRLLHGAIVKELVENYGYAPSKASVIGDYLKGAIKRQKHDELMCQYSPPSQFKEACRVKVKPSYKKGSRYNGLNGTILRLYTNAAEVKFDPPFNHVEVFDLRDLDVV